MTRSPWWTPIATTVAVLLLRLLAATWRIEYLPGFAARDRALRGGEACIYAFWHARMLPLVVTHRHRGAAVLVSRHHDGEWIARILARLGFTTARGSSTRGGDEALRGLLEFARAGTPLAVTPDGPRGPAERAKPGVAYLASRTGWAVQPVATASRSTWTARSWDRFRVPRPFTRVAVAYGDPVTVPGGLDAGALEPWRERIEHAIAATTAAAEQAVAARARSGNGVRR